MPVVNLRNYRLVHTLVVTALVLLIVLLLLHIVQTIRNPALFQAKTSCNQNGVCEAQLGETPASCPMDCR